MSHVLLEVLRRKAVSPPPVWLMRQAGRYLPEYREVRAKAGSFWSLCMSPPLAAEVTVQPVHRFGLDAAIVFSDILTVAKALGASVQFGEGPKLVPVRTLEFLDVSAANWREELSPLYTTLRLVKMQTDKPVLGFAGAPWTLATYMAAGGTGEEAKAAKLWAYRKPDEFGQLIDVICDCVAQHLVEQLKAGADAVQLFDSWASGLPERLFVRWVVEPAAKIVAKVKAAVPRALVIGFPRGATLAGYELYARETGINAISLDAAVPMSWAVEKLAPKVVLQGNLDSVALVAGGKALAEAVTHILEVTRGVPLIFNLGHGVLAETPPEHVAELVRLVRGDR